MTTLLKTILVVSCAVVLTGCTSSKQSISDEPIVLVPQATQMPIASATPSVETTVPKKGVISMVNAIISTTKGDIELELYADKAPNTVANFKKKATESFYANLTFHRVEDWVIQGGDPLGNGTGGGKMVTELNDVPFVTGSLGVARGQDIKVSNDAQFFICTQDCGWLTGQYTNFGKVTKGMDVVKSIAIGDKILRVSYSEK